MGEAHPLFSAWLIYESSKRGMTLYEYLLCYPPYGSTSIEANDTEDWGSSKDIEEAKEVAIDWGEGDFVRPPTAEPCDKPIIRTSKHVKH